MANMNVTPPRSPTGLPTPPLHELPVMEDHEPFDLLGVGFGPTNIALAVALHEEQPQKRALFVDSRSTFAWHPALLLPASRMQISFLKDLATFRNPQSTFTFISYLHSFGTDRLAAFCNLGTWTPTRAEWAAYLAWAAKRLEQYSRWSTTILSAYPVPTLESNVKLIKVTCLDSHSSTLRVYYTRNLVVGSGATPSVPSIFRPAMSSPTVVHTSSYLPTLQHLFPQTGAMPNSAFTGNFAVIGGGQSSAEVFNDLISRFPNAKVDMIHRSSALVPADDSPFVNARAFDPSRTAEFFGLNQNERADRLDEFRRTNYACVAPELIESLYKMLYVQNINGPTSSPQNRILANADVSSVVVLSAKSADPAKANTPPPSVQLTISSTLSTGPAPEVREYAAVFLGTGYHRPPSSLAFLSGLAPHFPALNDFLNPAEGAVPRLKTKRDYSVAPRDPWHAKLFVLGFGEHSHGLSEGLLSIGAVRAGEVVRALDAVTHDKKSGRDAPRAITPVDLEPVRT